MLKRIIKRSGVVEDFDAKKINKWVIWAAGDLIKSGRVDVSSIIMEVVAVSPEEMTSQDLQLALAKKCVSRHSWPYSLMGGTLYAVWCWKEFYGDRIPTVKQIDEQLLGYGIMKKLDYTDAEYELIEAMIDHTRDLKLAEFQIKQDINKYSLQNKVTKQKFETPQFIFMRMAMALAENDKGNLNRLLDVSEWYNYFSAGLINPPTPNFNNLGTPHNGYASCCLYKSGDDKRSLGVGKHIAYTMTYMSAGIGGYIESRSLGEGVAANSIIHQGKLPFYAGNGKDVKEMTKGGRGGAATQYITCYDPEIETVIMLQNPRTSTEIRNRDIHFSVMYNSFFAKKAGKKEKIFTFNVKSAPDLHKALFSGDKELFASLYDKYEKDDSFKKNYIDAYQLAADIETQGHEVSTLYSLDIEEVNRHTPFKEVIHSSNLCGEITQPTSEYEHIMDLYKTDHERGEISLCNLGGIVVSKIPFTKEGDALYEKVAYYTLKMADTTIDMADYEIPHLGYTAAQRRNAAIGMLGVAEVFARMGVNFDTQQGLDLAHRIAERHMYFVIKASLKLGQERGNAPWMHKTKWPEGWLPIDTYKKSVDTLTQQKLRYDWEELRAAIIANGGIRNSSLVAHMPTESSSKASGVPNGVYPIRDFYLKKTDQNNTIDWLAPDDDLYGEQYQNAYEIKTIDLIKYYAVIQKFTDQAISADFYENRVKNPILNRDDLVNNLINRVRYGVKSKYYQNSLTPSEGSMDESASAATQVIIPTTQIIGYGERADCASGACTL